MKNTIKFILLTTIIITCSVFLCSCDSVDDMDLFWETYQTWIIVSLIVVSIASTIYIIVMIIEDLEISDIFDFLEENIWLLAVLLIPSAGGVWAIIKSNWIYVVIIIAAVILFLLIVAIAHLIKYIVENISFGGSGYESIQKYSKNDDKDYFDNLTEDVSDYIDNFDMLMLFTKDQLKEYCKNNNISGYSKSTKAEIASIIISSKNEIEKVQTAKKDKTNSLEELDKLVGLESVKTQLKRIRAILLKNEKVEEKPNLHMCFLGNPGTGKTVVARLLANIFYETGVLPTNKLIETDRSGLCGQYVGQTTPLTHNKVKEAMGGVLFIDEAYTLDAKGEDYGKEAIAALLKDMEDYKGKFCVILAGYKNEMEKMISLNPGFDSRINRKIIFPDYTIDEQMQIFDIMLSKNKYEISENAKAKLMEIFEKKSKSKHFANARTVRNILDNLIEIQAVRTMDDIKNENERIIKINDVIQYIQENEDN